MDGMSLRVEQGERVAVIGPNGRGRSRRRAGGGRERRAVRGVYHGRWEVRGGWRKGSGQKWWVTREPLAPTSPVGAGHRTRPSIGSAGNERCWRSGGLNARYGASHVLFDVALEVGLVQEGGRVFGSLTAEKNRA